MNKYLIIGISVVLIGGAGYWVWTQNSTTSTLLETSTAPVANQGSQTTPYNERAPLNSTPNNQEPSVSVQLLGLTSANQTSLPILRYKVNGNVNGNGYVSIVSKSSGKTLWGMEQEPTGTHSLDLNKLTAVNGSEVDLPDGDYILKIQDRSGNLLAESATFYVAPGVMGN